MTASANPSPRVLTKRESRLIREADAFAAARHAGQVRAGDGAPFIEHPREVARSVAKRRARGALIAACLLHDVVEKTETSLAEVASAFGPEIARLVASVTEDPTIGDYGERKADLRRRVAAGGREPAMLLAADRVSKLPELGPDTPPERLEHERQCLAVLKQLIPRDPLIEQLRAGLASAQPPAAAES
ncbi:MAG TPA: HD domain-containing protein [Conexibacter sp.]|jgi:(p)ppGpp synthase/HD superfamily hydrolase